MLAFTDAHAQVTNVRGNMIALNGTSQYINTNSPLTTATNNITMEAWVNFQSVTASATCIFYNGDNFENGYGLYLLGGTYQILQGGIQLLNTGVPPTLNTWTHLALTINSGVWRVYQNGVQIFALALSPGAPIAPTINFRVGANSTGLSEFLNAQVDEVRFWNVVRTPSQLRENMHLTLNGNEAGLTAYYQFNETTGNAIDVIGGNNATLQGGTPRLASTLSVGGGVAKTVSVTNVSSGLVEIDLTTTNLEIDFNNTSTNPNNSIVVTQITAENPYNNALGAFDGYWVVRNFGMNASLSFNNIKAKILPTNNILNADLTTPSNLKLYTRINNSGTSTWSQVGSANSADNVTKEINFSSPTNTFLGEFVVGSNPTNLNSFITTWITTDNTITIPTTSIGYNYDITWTNLTNLGVGNGSITGVTGDYTITGLQNGSIYRVAITGDFPSIFFNNSPEAPKIRAIEQWGNIVWQSFQSAFAGCNNLTYTATDVPNLSNVLNMDNMFMNCTNFNGNIGTWNTSNVNSMSGTFNNANSFNQPLINWNVSNVTNMSYMFSAALAFNQSLSTGMFSGWNTSNVTNMSHMFENAIRFNQNIGGLNISNVTNMAGMLNSCGMTSFNYDNTLIGFQFQANNYSVKPNITIGVNGLKYCQGLNARNTLMLTRNWTFAGDVLACPFITTWVTNTTTITIPTTGTGYNYNIVWQNATNFGVGNGSATGITGSYTITGLQNGSTYQISIEGSFPRIFFVNGDGQAPKLRSVVQWGNIAWTSMASAFDGCSNLTTIPTTEAPNLSGVTDMSNMFRGAIQLNTNLSSWNVSNVTNMSNMFADASQFNGNLSSWNVSNVTNMGSMFAGATSFNGNISNWNVSNVTNMSNMFAGASQFNGNLSSWNVSNVINMSTMFTRATSFNQDISSWNVGNVIDMGFMFAGSITTTNFNQNIGSWNVSNVINMAGMFFNNTIFNQNIGSWNVSNVTNMSNMFRSAINFNQNISTWNVGNVTSMVSMFNNAISFNQNISTWNVSNVNNMNAMFNTATSFNQNLTSWNVSNVTDMSDIFSNTNLSIGNYDAILISFASQPVKSNVSFGVIGRNYCNGQNARNTLITTKNWMFSGDALRCINVSQKRGNALVLSGGTQSALTSSVVTSATNNVSIEGWVNFNNTGGGNAVCIFYNGNNFSNGYGLYLFSNRVHILFGGLALIDTGITPALNTWIHLALVNNGINWIVYQNGISIGTFTMNAITPTDNFRIGSNVDGTTEFLNGQVDEVRVWNIGLSIGQIRENMHLTLDGSQVNLIGYYQINETSGNNVIDGIGANNITLNNVTRAVSTLAVASGTFHRRTATTGVNNFTNANLTINFTNNPLVELVAYQLNDNSINGIVNNAGTNTPSCYWIVRQFGTGSVAYDGMRFTLPASNSISTTDEANPSNLKLYKRPDNS
ncbi:MAG: BspA family leucine-rich repeat surface protein, partial [Bacteroidetes bacterium]